jgi:hypothetical protein
MAVGWLFDLGGNSYLLVGVPLLVVFQLAVRRQPLSCLWMRDRIRFQPGRLGWLIGLIWAALPIAKLVAGAGTAPWPITLWYIACAVGAFGTGFALRHFDRDTVQSLWHCLMSAGLVGCITVLTAAVTLHRSLVPTLPRVTSGAVDFLLYVPVCFVLAEVVFGVPWTRTCTIRGSTARYSPPCSSPHCGDCGTCRS